MKVKRMTRSVGTTVRGIRAPIVHAGDDLVDIVVQSVLTAKETEGFALNDRDIIGVTESILARAQGNYAAIDHIAADVRRQFTDDVAVVFPILSRNRFAPLLQGIARSDRQIYLFLRYPADEWGNHLMDIDALDASGINPWLDVLTEERYREVFGSSLKHPYTGVDYVEMYKAQAVDDNIHIFFANDPRAVLDVCRDVIVANVHERHRVRRQLLQNGANRVITLDELLNEPIDGSGYNAEYGLLGANMATGDTIKLFPRDAQAFVEDVQRAMEERTGRRIEVMVYGDGAFKDPMGRIWELADPVVSPGYTAGLEGQPDEIKLKYVADTEFADLTGAAAEDALRRRLTDRRDDDNNEAAQVGTTPRRLTDLLGSLCDLTSGSGEKGTPIVLVQGYFDNYASE